MARRDESNIPIWISIEMKSQFCENNVHGMKLLHDFLRGNILKGIDKCWGPWSLEQFIQTVKFVKLDENSWTRKKLIKASFRWPMSAVVRLVHVPLPLAVTKKPVCSEWEEKIRKRKVQNPCFLTVLLSIPFDKLILLVAGMPLLSWELIPWKNHQT